MRGRRAKVKASGEIPRHASSGVDPKVFDEHEVEELCTEVEQVLGKLRRKRIPCYDENALMLSVTRCIWAYSMKCLYRKSRTMKFEQN
ncbi:hypothetical protein FOZ60_006329 [Perkinsus olseni]|uniref:Uncharacterized protein n=1 Tax=Perkinsus olseni TaxID=32597 RepID=A0A7J6NQ68_PEROL|nr:hypothetical protein FOZ60_006329 [Perkinsus olseni]